MTAVEATAGGEEKGGGGGGGGWVSEERNWRESRWGMGMERSEGRLVARVGYLLGLGFRCVGWIGSTWTVKMGEPWGAPSCDLVGSRTTSPFRFRSSSVHRSIANKLPGDGRSTYVY
jgi:hypothetical protein